MAEITPKEDFMTKCMASGKTEADCEVEWANKSGASSADSKKHATDVDLMYKIGMLEAQLETRENQLRQAIDIANRANDERKAKEQVERDRLISSLVVDGFSKDDLAERPLGDLQTIRMSVDKVNRKTFASVAADIEAAKRRKTPYLTAGAWDAKKQDYVGGL